MCGCGETLIVDHYFFFNSLAFQILFKCFSAFLWVMLCADFSALRGTQKAGFACEGVSERDWHSNRGANERSGLRSVDGHHLCNQGSL